MTEVEEQSCISEEPKVEGEKIETLSKKKEEKPKIEISSNENNSVKENESKIEEATSEEKENYAKEGESKTGKIENEISKLEYDIIRQVEYYFGDANLHRDKFLLEQISKDSDGWVPLGVLISFTRLASLTTNTDVIANALAKSDEGLIEISEDKKKIRRHPERPIPEYNEKSRKEIASRTAYAKGFPLDTEMSELIDFFNPFEKVVNIVMRKYMDKPTKTYKFKGSVFVTFSTKEQCEEFVNKAKVQYKDKDLLRKWQEKYLEERQHEREALAAKKKAKAKTTENKIELPKGTVLHFDGCDENTTREHIKEVFSTLKTDVAFVEYVKGDKSGYVRLPNENGAQAFLDKIEDNKLTVNSVELTIRKLTEDEEKEFLEKVVDQMKSKRYNQNKNNNRNKGRKRKASEKNDTEPSEKK